MTASYAIAEISSIAFFLWFAWDAKRKGTRWLSTLVCGALFGLVVELALVSGAGASYKYGKFFLMVPWRGHEVPLWVGLGWGAILYAATWTAQRLAQPWYFRPLSAALLAVNIDLSLDPIAQHLGYWTWKAEAGRADYYGVPFDNFLGWFMIVGSYALFVRGIFRKVKARYGADYWVPALSAVGALGLVYLANSSVSYLYAMLGGQAIVFTLAFAVTCAIVWGYALRSKRDSKPDRVILALPIYYHLQMLGILLATGSFQAPTLATLLVVIPLNLVVGFFAYAWMSMEQLLPTGPKQP